MHITTASWSKLPRDRRDGMLLSLGITAERLEEIRSLPPRDKLLEAAKAAVELEPSPNSDLIEYIAGYGPRGGLYQHFANLDELLGKALVERRVNRLKPIETASSELDIIGVIPDEIGKYPVYTESADKSGRVLLVWQRVSGGTRSAFLNRKVSKLLFLSGVLLYAGEGSKYSIFSRRVEIVNSNVSILALFIRFLGTLGIGRSKVRARLHIHNPQEESEEKQFWRTSLGLGGNQFSKSVLKSQGKTQNRKRLRVLDLRYSNSMLNVLLRYWTENLEEIVDRVGSAL